MSIKMLELSAAPLHPTVLFDGTSLTLVDTGLPGFRNEILDSIRAAGLGDLRLDTIILTHQDFDHIGGLPQFLAAADLANDERPAVYAHADDIAVIDGKAPIIKVPEEKLAQRLSQFPEEVATQYRATFSPDGPGNVSDELKDGQSLPFGGGVTVIHTPGHTPGHVCLYHHASKTLVAGDAMIVNEGQLMGPNPAFTPDLNQALRSLKKLAAYDIEQVICYHGGLYADRVNERIAEIAAQAE